MNALRLVSQVVFTRSSGFVLEFIQNAEDAGQTLPGKGEVTISINRSRLKFVHNGAPGDRANVTKRAIAIAFAMDSGGNLDPSPATAMYGGVYSFLPLGESKSGAKFPIQADFLVQPGREGINEESAWNHWLLEQVADLCKTAIAFFQKHDTWKYQYLGIFQFTKAPGYEHENLFRPMLIEPIEQFLKDNPCALTADGKWAKLSEVVFLAESTDAAAALVTEGLMAASEIAPILGGSPNLQLVHPKVAEAQPDLFRKVDRWSLFENDDFLKRKAASADGPTWFRALYAWLNNFPVYENYFYYTAKKRIRRYDGKEIILNADKSVVQGAGVWLLDLASADPLISKLAFELQQKKPTLHPDILAGAATDQERQSLKGFLLGLAGVNAMDIKAVCEEAILPKILSTAPQPPKPELLDYTKCCCRYLGTASISGSEIWTSTKLGAIRPAREVYFPTEFKPAQNWEINKAYVKGLDFLSPDYVSSCKDDSEFRAWRDFMHAAGVKLAPDNGVEVFAMNYSKEKLAVKFNNVVEVDKLNHGYDLEAEDEAAMSVQIEVKGQATDADVELTGNEAKAAKKHGQSFYLCVVSSIPESPVIHLVCDPDRVGEKEKLTIRVNDWKSGRWLPVPLP